MLPIAGQTAGPNGLNIFVDTHGFPGDVLGFFRGQRRALQLVINTRKWYKFRSVVS